MKAIGYVRVSTTDQDTSLAVQEERIRAYCTLAGLALAGVVRDEGVSGAVALSERPGGRQLLELPNWLVYDDGTDDLSEMRLAIVVTDTQDLGREPRVDGGRGGRRYIGRYQYSGTVYYLRNDDDPRLDGPMPAGAVPFEKIESLPNAVRVSGLQPRADA